jgi:acetylglutamate kinase
MEHLTVVKIGGNVIDSPEATEQFLTDFENLSGLKILVHGGGKVATEISKKLGIEAQMIDGRRVTDAATLDVVVMVYAGLINKRLVARLNAGGKVRAVGITGAEDSCIQSIKRPVGEIDYGFVGDIQQVDSGYFSLLLTHMITPIVAPITWAADGQLLNTNADTIASAIAETMSRHMPTDLIYCFEKKGVLSDANNPDSVIPAIDSMSYRDLKGKGIISAGMIPKLDNAFVALNNGVRVVRICAYQDLLTRGGTAIVE